MSIGRVWCAASENEAWNRSCAACCFPSKRVSPWRGLRTNTRNMGQGSATIEWIPEEQPKADRIDPERLKFCRVRSLHQECRWISMIRIWMPRCSEQARKHGWTVRKVHCCFVKKLKKSCHGRAFETLSNYLLLYVQSSPKKCQTSLHVAPRKRFAMSEVTRTRPSHQQPHTSPCLAQRGGASPQVPHWRVLCGSQWQLWPSLLSD